MKPKPPPPKLPPPNPPLPGPGGSNLGLGRKCCGLKVWPPNKGSPGPVNYQTQFDLINLTDQQKHNIQEKAFEN